MNRNYNSVEADIHQTMKNMNVSYPFAKSLLDEVRSEEFADLEVASPIVKITE